jgi:excisionase family DNA binding protein
MSAEAIAGQPSDNLLTLKQGRERLQVSRSTFWKLINEHSLPVFHAGGVVRISERALADWIAKHTRGGNAHAA